MRIMFVPTLNAPVVYYRMENFVKYLRKQGHEVGFSYAGPKTQRSCLWEHKLAGTALWSLGKFGSVEKETFDLMNIADVAVVQVVHTERALDWLRFLKDHFKKPMLVEIDDDPLSASFESIGTVAPGSAFERNAVEHLQMADGIICSTPFLAERVKRWCRKVHVVPNAIDFELYDDLKVKVRKRPTAGWIGGGGHRQDLRLLRDVFKDMKDVKFVLYSGHLPIESLDFPNVTQWHMTEKPSGVSHMAGKMWWRTILEYPAFMAGMGLWVGLAPLVDTMFSRTKSNLRWLEYSALGIPTVASPVEHFKASILDGKTGFLPQDDDGWKEAIGALTKDRGLRDEMGRLARAEVREKFNAEEVSKQYADILKGYT